MSLSDRQTPRKRTAEYVDSYYAASVDTLPPRSSLIGETEADVCVIGGGYTGISAALHLAERDYDVIVLEAERLGWGASGRNGGHVGIGQRKDQDDLEKQYGRDTALRLWSLGLEANALVKSLIAQHEIDCDLKAGILHVAAKPAHAQHLRDYAGHLADAYDYPHARYVERDEVRAMLGTNRYFGGSLESEGAHLHPLKYLLGLAAAAEKRGARLYEGSRVIEYQPGETITVKTARGTVHAKHLVFGCNGYLERLENTLASRIMPINNFVLATEQLSEEHARALIRDDVAVADTLFVINYWKLSADNRLLFGGGENYTRRFPRDIGSFVRKYMLRVYPQLSDTKIDYAWGGTLAITLNRMPSFGRLADNIFYAQGYSGHGVPTATMAGKLIAEAVTGTPGGFDVMAGLATPRFPGGVMLRWPGLVVGMAYHALLDKL